MAVIPIFDFDSGLWLLSGRSAIPENAARVYTGINPIHSKSVQSRNGNVRLSTNPAISAARFASHYYTLDTTGHFQKDFVTLVSGFTNGQRISFAKAPPHFGSNAYLFAIGGGKAIKVDESGNATNWGIAAPADGAAAALSTGINSVTINNWTTTAGLTALYKATLNTDTTEFIISPSSVNVSIPKGANGGFKETVSVNLNPSGATDDDTINFFVMIDNPSYVKSIVLDFKIGAGNYTNFYTITIPISAITGNNSQLGTQSVGNLDGITSSLTAGLQAVPSVVGNNQLETEFGTSLTNWSATRGGTNAGNATAQFKPSLGAQHILQNINTVIQAGPYTWWNVRVPRRAFIQHRGTANNWANITGYRLRVYNNHSTNPVNLWFNGLTFSGGTGMLGDYQWIYTFKNSTTGSYSQQNPTPVLLSSVSRVPVSLSSLPTSSADAQVDTLTLWRTMGNGGVYYKLIDIPLSGFAGTFLDVASDFFGFGPDPSKQPNWANGTTYGTNSLILPTSGNDGKYVFAATTGGTSAGGAPAWPQNVGSTVADNTVVWQNVGSLLTLGIEPYFGVNILPATTVTQCAFWRGTMFLCGDTASGAKGRVYYSAPGYAEGVAGYTDITNDDDPTVGFGIYNDNLFVFTQKAMWRVVDISVNAFLPGFAVVQEQGAPGCGSAQSIVATPGALIYQGSNDGLFAFDGYFANRLAPQILPLFRGVSVEGYLTIGKITAACYARDEYWFSDAV